MVDMKEELFSNSEKHVLKKFVKENIVIEEDEQILYRYASIGFVRFGFNWCTMTETAKLTDSGLEHLNR